MKRSIITLAFALSSAIPFAFAQAPPGSPELPTTPGQPLPPPPKTNVPGPGPGANPRIFPKETREAREAAEAAGRAAAPAANAGTELPAPTNESEFLNMLGASNRAQLKLAKLAAQRSENAEVKGLAKSMTRDLTTGGTALARLNKTLGFKASTAAEEGADATYARLSSLNGAAFDTAFLQEVQRAQTANISAFQAAGSFAGTKAVKSYITSSLPGLQASATRVDALSVAAGGSAANPASGPTTSGAVPGTNPAPINSPAVPAPGGSGTNQPGGPQGAVPGTNAPSNPNQTPGSVPNEGNAQRGSDPGTNPNVNPGVNPGGANPGQPVAPGQNPGTPGVNPGVNPGAVPGSNAGGNRGTRPGGNGGTPGRSSTGGGGRSGPATGGGGGGNGGGGGGAGGR